jgi:hypothetical protein
MPTETYVHDDIEVVKTGRTADRPLRSGKVETLVEITPKDQSLGTWRKWVDPIKLFVIQASEQ